MDLSGGSQLIRTDPKVLGTRIIEYCTESLTKIDCHFDEQVEFECHKATAVKAAQNHFWKGVMFATTKAHSMSLHLKIATEQQNDFSNGDSRQRD